MQLLMEILVSTEVEWNMMSEEFVLKASKSFWSHVDTIIEKKWWSFYVNLMFCVYFILFFIFFNLKLILFYNCVVYHYTKIIPNFTSAHSTYSCVCNYSCTKEKDITFWLTLGVIFFFLNLLVKNIIIYLYDAFEVSIYTSFSKY